MCAKKSDVRGGEPDIAHNKLERKEGVFSRGASKETPVNIMITHEVKMSRKSKEKLLREAVGAAFSQRIKLGFCRFEGRHSGARRLSITSTISGV